MPRFDFNPRTGRMEPRKDEQIYFAGSMGGGLRIDDHKNNIKYVIERDGRITNIAGVRGADALNIYDMRDARIIADRVARMFTRSHPYADFHRFLKGYRMHENVVLNFDEYVEEGWGALIKRDVTAEVRDEDVVRCSGMEFWDLIKKEIEKQKDGDTLKIPACRVSDFWFTTGLSTMSNILYPTPVRKLDFSSVVVVDDEVDLSNMFFNMKDVEEIRMPQFSKGTKITDAKNMFKGCVNLKKIYNLGNMDVSNVTDFGFMFSDCRVTDFSSIEHWNVSNVTNFYGMFAGCDVESIDLSGWNMESASDLSYMFKDCKNLKSLNVGNWNTSNVKGMECMFSFCESIKTIDLSGWDTSSATSMEGMFSRCPVLEDIVFGPGWNTHNVYRMSKMFNECPSLTHLDVSSWDVERLGHALYMFKNSGVEDTVDLTGWYVPGLTDDAVRKIVGKTQRFEIGDDKKLKKI